VSNGYWVAFEAGIEFQKKEALKENPFRKTFGEHEGTDK
jgi:hypothetical protein